MKSKIHHAKTGNGPKDAREKIFLQAYFVRALSNQAVALMDSMGSKLHELAEVSGDEVWIATANGLNIMAGGVVDNLLKANKRLEELLTIRKPAPPSPANSQRN